MVFFISPNFVHRVADRLFQKKIWIIGLQLFQNTEKNNLTKKQHRQISKKLM